ncbi:hypothetical protein SAMN02745857_02740 [Andreprevotia lacus DSM 23236]|jgi:hypothetical protein|uniref:Uncharacterized protein n=1 Tax=Andreprevotia lacus DSM 23236 TaxID=1121001 RepID=A0A1W1XT75_9NEIS|nr:hypothetical protein [Andreprevotia lacus]SMC27180.1 hypothetical protein SAMN02745857_02740 [Andreprevotia lacus DSM 23236]
MLDEAERRSAASHRIAPAPGSVRGMAASALQRTLDRAFADWRNGRLRVVQNASEARTLLQGAPAVPLGEGTAGARNTAQSEGFYLPASGDIILIADHLPSAEHAVWAAAHELGLRQADRTALPAAARELRNLALVARQNRSVNALVSAIARQRGLDDSLPSQRQQAAEAALAELAATRHSGDWDALQQRYGVRMPLARRDSALGVQARFADKLQDWFGRYAGMRQNEGAQVSAVLAEMLAGGDGQRAARVAGDVGLAGEAGREHDIPKSTVARELLGTGQAPKLVYQQNAGNVIRTREYMLNLAREMGVYIPDDVYVIFVDPSLLSNKVGAMAEYGQTGNYLGANLAAIMTWDGMKNINNMIPVRLSENLLSSDEAAVAHIAHEMYELEKFESLGVWNQRTFIKQTASPEFGGLQDSWHSQAWDYADQIVEIMRGYAR